MSKTEYVLDIEVSPNFFLVGMKRISDGKTVLFEQSDRSEIDWDKLDGILRGGRIITFNGRSFDVPVLWYGIERQPPCHAIKAAANKLISERVPHWRAGKELGVWIPRWLDHIDLIDPQPAVGGKDGSGNAFPPSLKTLNGRMHGRHMADLPYAHDKILTHDEMDRVREYNINDLAATESLYKAIRKPIELREQLSEMLGKDVRSLSDPQVGIEIIKSRAEKILGRQIRKEYDQDLARTFRYEPPAWLSYETPALREMLRRLREHDFVVGHDGKVRLPEFLDEPIFINGTPYQMGIGGLHSKEKGRAVHSTFSHRLIDADVASYYPAVILGSGLYPENFGPAFLDAYRQIRDDRVAAKRAGNKTIDKGMKIALNGVFGKLGSPSALVYAPDLMIAVTLGGQLALMMLIERAEAAGIRVVSANTDGVLFSCPREMQDGVDGGRLRPSALEAITSRWEQETQFDLEFGEYLAVYSAAVNTYFALKPNGGHKRKGDIANPWSQHKDDFDPERTQLMKNPQMTICSDAALAKLKHGTPVEDTIRACDDIRQFVRVVNARGGATWRGEYLGKVVRYYWSTDGDPILSAKPHPTSGKFGTVSQTDGGRPCMTLPDSLPRDIDYARYVEEAEKILVEVGYYGRPPEQLKFGRLTAAKLEALTPWLLLA